MQGGGRSQIRGLRWLVLSDRTWMGTDPPSPGEACIFSCHGRRQGHLSKTVQNRPLAQ